MKTYLTAALLATALVSTVKAANITYNVDLSGGGVTVIGTITTDGALGSIFQNSIVNFDLVVSDGITTSDINATHGYFGESDPGALFQATNSELTYDAAGTPGFELFWGPGLNSFFCLAASSAGCGNSPTYSSPGYGVGLNWGSGSQALYTVPESGVFVVGTTGSAPEPATAMLLIGGLGISLLVRKRMLAETTKASPSRS